VRLLLRVSYEWVGWRFIYKSLHKKARAVNPWQVMHAMGANVSVRALISVQAPNV